MPPKKNQQIQTSSKASQVFGSKRIRYWEGLIVDPLIVKTYIKVFSQLISGQLNGADFCLKKARGHKLYTIRINDADRLLFTEGRVHGKSCLIFLEVIQGHAYDKSVYMNNPICTKRHIDNMTHTDAPNLTDDSLWEDTDWQQLKGEFFGDEDTSGDEKGPVKPLKWTNNRYIEFVLNPSQQEAMNTSLPLVISGNPGAGKSSLIPELLRQSRHLYRKIICLTSTPLLLEKLTDQCSDLLLLPQEDAALIEYKTWEALVYEKNPAMRGRDKVGQKEFSDWYLKFLADARKIKRKNITGSKQTSAPPLTDRVDDPVRVYQEIRNASGYTSIEYIRQNGTNAAFGEKKSNERQWIYHVFLRWVAHINHSGSRKVDLAFVQLNQVETESDIMVLWDEAQDASGMMWNEAFRIAGPNKAMVSFIGPHQSVHDIYSPIPFMKQMLSKAGMPINHRILSQTWANACLDRRHTGVQEKHHLSNIISSNTCR